MPGFYNDCTLEKIACINRAGIRSVVMTTVSGTNIDEVPGIIDSVVAAGANVFAFARYCPTSEYFNLGVRPIFRETYSVNGGQAAPKGYRITDACIGCGRCAANCPQSCITPGQPYAIQPQHCLHCGNCFEHCPVQAIVRC